MTSGKYLYRGLNEKEIKAKRLCPKQQTIFPQEPKTPVKTPFKTGASPENASRNHQKGYATSGVSTSVTQKAAIKYATNNGKKSGIIAVVLIEKLAGFGIKMQPVDKSGEIIVPEDKEIILYNNTGDAFPELIVKEFIEVSAQEFTS